MTRFIPSLIACLAMLGFVVWKSAYRDSVQSDLDLDLLARLPAKFDGRIQPLDTIAKTSLRGIYGNSVIRQDDGRRLMAIEWLAEVLFAPEKAAQRPTIRVGNNVFRSTVRRAHKIEVMETSSFEHLLSLADSAEAAVPRAALARYQARIDREAQGGEADFGQEPVRLKEALIHYDTLALSARPPLDGPFLQELERLQELARDGLEAIKLKQAGDAYAVANYDAMMDTWNDYQELDRLASISLIPPEREGASTEWSKMPGQLAIIAQSGAPDPIALLYAKLGDSYRANDSAAFNETLAEIKAAIQAAVPEIAGAAASEMFFNRFNPFLAAKIGYAAAFLLAITSWIRWTTPLRMAGRWFAGLSVLLHTIGLWYQFSILGYAATPTIYASTVFVGWAAALFGFVLSFSTRSRLGIASSSVAGFGFLWNRLSEGALVAYTVSGAKSTGLFWQASRELSLGLAYASLILAGILSFLYVIRVFFKKSYEPAHAAELETLLYYLSGTAFVTSIVAGLCGGFWTDSEYGRFWAWDTFECRMLVMALWSAIYIQGRWSGYFHGRNPIALALIGSIAAIWSWSGTPPITEAAAAVEQASPPGIISTIALTAALCAILPLRMWRVARMPSNPPRVSTE